MGIVGPFVDTGFTSPQTCRLDMEMCCGCLLLFSAPLTNVSCLMGNIETLANYSIIIVETPQVLIVDICVCMYIHMF